MQNQSKRENKIHYCSMCKRDAATWDDPAKRPVYLSAK